MSFTKIKRCADTRTGAVVENVATTLHVSFLSRVSTLTRDIDIADLSVRLSVRHVPVLDENGLTYCHSFFTTR